MEIALEYSYKVRFCANLCGKGGGPLAIDAVAQRAGIPLEPTWRSAAEQIVSSLAEIAHRGSITVKLEQGMPKSLYSIDSDDFTEKGSPVSPGLTPDALRTRLVSTFGTVDYGEVKVHVEAGVATRIETVRTKRLPLVR